MTDTQIDVLVVDDHPVVLDGMTAVISQHARMRVVACAGSGKAALDAYGCCVPAIVVTDMSLPDMSGAELIAALRKFDPQVRCLVLTVHARSLDIQRALEAGCRGYLLKNAHREELHRAIETVYEGGAYFSAQVASSLLEARAPDALTEREREVLRRLVDGRRDKEIARELVLSQATVRTHVTRILAKLGVTTRTQAVLAALQQGLV